MKHILPDNGGRRSDIVFNGIRYINTGAWTEPPVFYIQVTGDELYLKIMDESSYKS